MTYEEALDYIGSVSWKGSVPGLSRIKQLTELMGNPQDSLKFIHVAGTNGKGSTCAFLSFILKEAGYKVGLFTSPFINVFNERMQINNENISNEELAEIVEYIKPFADSMEDKPTEFELNTAIGFEYFKRNNCDIVVLEVGMGGALDSTNIIKSAELAIITTISLDHTQYLGDTVEKIAETKSGIIKSGANVVLYNQENNIRKVIEKRCCEVGAELYISDPSEIGFISSDITGQIFSISGLGAVKIGLQGSYQLNNVATVIKAVEVLRKIGYKISDESVKNGLAKTRWPGRFEIINEKPLFLVDGAHNPEGITAAADSLKKAFPGIKFVMIFGVLADKEYENMIKAVAPLAKEVLTVRPDSVRALAQDKTADVFKKYNVKAVAYDNIREAVEDAFRRAGQDGFICALGSLYMIGDIRKYILKEID